MFMSQATLAIIAQQRSLKMTEVTFVTSVKGIQDERVKSISTGLKEKRPDVNVSIIPGDKNVELLTKLKLKHGPCVIIDGRMQFVGIPNLRMVLERLDMIAKKEVAQTSATVASPPAQTSTAPTK